MKTCNQCGREFSCVVTQPESKCWCMDMPPLEPIPKRFSDCLCPQCLVTYIKKDLAPAQEPIESQDYYYENGFRVFTRAYHLKRGHCCGSGCRHCPYPAGDTEI